MKDFLENTIIEVGGYILKLHNVVNFILFVAFIVVLLIVFKWLIYRLKTLDSAKKFSINKLSRYIIAIISFFICLHILGFNISVLLAGSAAVLVGLGFGLQNLFSDFISGIILLLDGSLKVDDIYTNETCSCIKLKVELLSTMFMSKISNLLKHFYRVVDRYDYIAGNV
jgi:small-conductance mechanosensitive channel